MKTPILSASGLLLFMTGSLLAASQGTNTVSPADATVATPAEAPTAAPAEATAAQNSVLARLAAARRAADAAGVPDASVAATPAPAASMAPSTATPPAPIASAANDSTPPGFTAFQIITRRNIFDPNRRPYVRDAVFAPNTNRAPRVEEFDFRSASEKVGMGYTAFFTGYGVPRSGEVQTNDVINGFKVKDITMHQVKLVDMRTTNLVTMNEQTGLRRQDGGPWNWTLAYATYPSVQVARAQPQPDYQQYQQPQPFSGAQQFNIRTFNPPDDGSGSTDLTGIFGNNPGGRNRNRGNGGQGRRGGGNGGNFGGAAGFGNTADDTVVAPLSPADAAAAAAAEARMRARRAQEN